VVTLKKSLGGGSLCTLYHAVFQGTGEQGNKTLICQGQELRSQLHYSRGRRGEVKYKQTNIEILEHCLLVSSGSAQVS